MNEDRTPRLTVLMPLHRAKRWANNVSVTIARCPAASRIIVSDITQQDDALDVLERRHQNDRRVRFRRATGKADWRLHVNELLSLVDTELFSIMPQDDEISPDYYDKLVGALDANPSAGLAFGVIDSLRADSMQRKRMSTVPIRLGVHSPWQEAIHLDRYWNLGIPYRGVVRREFNWLVPLIPHDFADQIWTFGIAILTHFVEVPTAVYLKRYHDDNTHTSWTQMTTNERRDVLLSVIETRLGHQPHAAREAKHELTNPHVLTRVKLAMRSTFSPLVRNLRRRISEKLNLRCGLVLL